MHKLSKVVIVGDEAIGKVQAVLHAALVIHISCCIVLADMYRGPIERSSNRGMGMGRNTMYAPPVCSARFSSCSTQLSSFHWSSLGVRVDCCCGPDLFTARLVDIPRVAANWFLDWKMTNGDGSIEDFEIELWVIAIILVLLAWLLLFNSGCFH